MLTFPSAPAMQYILMTEAFRFPGVLSNFKNAALLSIVELAAFAVYVGALRTGTYPAFLVRALASPAMSPTPIAAGPPAARRRTKIAPVLNQLPPTAWHLRVYRQRRTPCCCWWGVWPTAFGLGSAAVCPHTSGSAWPRLQCGLWARLRQVLASALLLVSIGPVISPSRQGVLPSGSIESMGCLQLAFNAEQNRTDAMRAPASSHVS